MTINNPPSPPVRELATERGYSSNVCDGGFEYLLRRWKGTVGLIEAGYTRLIDEYLNDMDARRIINELLPVATVRERQEVEAVLPQLDARFFAATRPVATCIWGEANAAKRGYDERRDWWYYRVPIRLDRVRDPELWPA